MDTNASQAFLYQDDFGLAQKYQGIITQKYLTHAPHVDRGPVLQAQYDFRASVEPRLDVGVDPSVCVARAAEVYHFD